MEVWTVIIQAVTDVMSEIKVPILEAVIYFIELHETENVW